MFEVYFSNTESHTHKTAYSMKILVTGKIGKQFYLAGTS